jgi:tRNA A-37 threonylcarbamoyl transferase component Bud32
MGLELDPGELGRLQQVARRQGWSGLEFESLAGGTRNRSLHVRHATGEAVVRIAGALDPEYAVARDAESLAQRAAAERLLAPRILFEDRESGVLVSEYVAGEVWSRETARTPEAARRMGAWLGRLHGTAMPAGLRTVDFAASLVHYADALAPGKLPDRLRERAGEVAARLRRGQEAVLCHNDLHHLNLIDSARGLVAVDWEYAGAGTGVMDVAGFAAYHELDDETTDVLLVAYAGALHPGMRERLADARWLFEAVWWAWLELRCQLEGGEPEALRIARTRLMSRVRVQP